MSLENNEQELLRECPFCGYNECSSLFDARIKEYYVECPNCGACGEHTSGTHERAKELWNLRHCHLYHRLIKECGCKGLVPLDFQEVFGTQPSKPECSHDIFVGDYCAVCDRILPFGKPSKPALSVEEIQDIMAKNLTPARNDGSMGKCAKIIHAAIEERK